jgi:hypothetical protein
VATVDGLSVMDGQTGDLHKSSGYVLAPYQTAIIPGWRLNNQDVAAFRFSFPGDSYAAKIGKPTNLGVIGCAFFEEVVKPLFTPSPYPSTPHPFPYQPFLHDWHGTSIEYGEQVRSMYTTGGGRGSSMGSANVVHSYNNSPSLGTEFGERREHRVVTTSFDRQGAPAVVLTIRYETHLRLQEMGITSSTPAAFTSYAGVGATPPAGWRG